MTEKEEEKKKKLDEQTHKSIKHNLTQHLSREKWNAWGPKRRIVSVGQEKE